MKIALYIEDGLEQIVLTPETDTEKGIIGKMHDDSRVMTIKHGSFYECRGGWTRHKQQYYDPYGTSKAKDDESTIIMLRPKPPEQPPEANDGASLGDGPRGPEFMGGEG